MPAASSSNVQSRSSGPTRTSGPETDVLGDRFRLDHVEILSSMPGSDASVARDEWVASREAAGKPPHLQALPGEPQSAGR